MDTVSIHAVYLMQSQDFVDEDNFIGLQALFNKNATSIIFLILFVFFTVFILHIEILLFQSEYDRLEFVCAIPLVSMLVHLTINLMKISFDNLNKFLMIGLSVMISLSIVHLSFELSDIDARFFIFLILISQMAIYQKMFFMQIMIYLLKKFEISSIHQQNQINGELNKSS